jgi:hypothetical protein
MNKTLNVFIGAFTGLVIAISAMSSHEARNARAVSLNAYAINSTAEANLYEQNNIQQDTPSESDYPVEEVIEIPTESITEQNKTGETVVASNTDTGKSVTLSRGAAPSMSTEKNVQAAKPTEVKKPKTELLDWWKEARYVFDRDDIATVKDLYTGKTFKVKRTMGTNHVDAEALTKEDTKIIKSIWGGFSWDRRPVHIYIDGRVLAASMSAMPHAGIDSAPAYAYVKNRSDGYGSGENLDVIKGNDMDGHFDIHFINSTRHKDDKKDPEHQATIKIAAQR